MKLIKFLTFIILMFFFAIKINADSSIYIDSISLEDKSENTSIIEEPKFNNLDIDFSISFSDKNDFIKYKINIVNNTKKDLYISDKEYFMDSEYIKYKLFSEDVIKANDQSVIYLEIQYADDIDETLMVDNEYNEVKKASIEFLDENGEVITNPKTGGSLFLLFLLLFLLICIVAYFIIRKRSVIILSVLFICFLPLIIFAAEPLMLSLNVKVKINKLYSVDYYYDWSNVLIYNDMIDNFDLSNTTCKYIYINDYNIENRHYLCEDGVIYKGNKYKIGEEVIFQVEDYFLAIRDEDLDVVDENTYFAYPYHIKRYVSEIRYDKNIMELFNYKYYEDIYENEFICLDEYDYEESCYLGSWASNGYARFDDSKIKFNMPAHDMLFSIRAMPI